MCQALIIWLPLFMHEMPWAFVFAFASAGRRMPARIAIIAITTRSSMSVKPEWREWRMGTFIISVFGLGCLEQYKRASGRANVSFGRTGWWLRGTATGAEKRNFTLEITNCDLERPRGLPWCEVLSKGSDTRIGFTGLFTQFC